MAMVDDISSKPETPAELPEGSYCMNMGTIKMAFKLETGGFIVGEDINGSI